VRIAAIDIGTNSIHMIVVQLRADQSFEVVDREKEMVRLGEGGLGGRALTEASMMATLQMLSKFRRLAESHDVDEIVAAATSAVREAENGREFLTAVRQRTGIRVRVISGTIEARLIHRAAVYGVDVAAGAAVVIDIGGGSVELTRGTSTKVQVASSAKIGVIRLTERFVGTDPLAIRDERRLTKCIENETSQSVEQILKLGFDRDIGHHPEPRAARGKRIRGGRFRRPPPSPDQRQTIQTGPTRPHPHDVVRTSSAARARPAARRFGRGGFDSPR
jgi:exopolyphosphatase/guanosine-5'-triphosphate,3'-diphosphate pyrophosphatase